MRIQAMEVAALMALGSLMAGGCASHHDHAKVVVTPEGQVITEGPPPARVEMAGPPPADTYVWVPGYWTYQNSRWVWLPGRYELAPHSGATWVPGHWDRNEHHQWYWTPGHWA